jgi:hypothetical protein
MRPSPTQRFSPYFPWSVFMWQTLPLCTLTIRFLHRRGRRVIDVLGPAAAKGKERNTLSQATVESGIGHCQGRWHIPLRKAYESGDIRPSPFSQSASQHLRLFLHIADNKLFFACGHALRIGRKSMSNVEHPWTLPQVDDLSLRRLINLRLAPDLGDLENVVVEMGVDADKGTRRLFVAARLWVFLGGTFGP